MSEIGEPTAVVTEGWESDERKHIFILSSSGKPIFSRYGDEQALVATFGLLQAIVSIVQDQGDSIHCIKAGQRRIVYFIRQSLYFISISSTGEPEVVLAKQLEFMYNQVLLTLTNKVHTVLTQNSSKDLRDLLGCDTTRLMQSACSGDLTPTCIAFESARGYVIEVTELREELLTSLRECVEMSGAALGLILCADALVAYAPNSAMSLNLQVSDVLLLTHFVENSASLRSHDQHWVPLCLPQFNPGAFLQAYVCDLRVNSQVIEENRHIDLSLVLISSSSDASMFKELHAGREALEQALVAPSVAPRLLATLDQQSTALTKYLGPAMCLHFLYKLRPAVAAGQKSAIPAQCLSTPMDFPINNEDSQEKIWLQYQRLGVCLRKGTSLAECTLVHGMQQPTLETPAVSTTAGAAAASPISAAPEVNVMSTVPTSDHALAYTVLGNGHVVVGLAASDSELYATFPGTCSALEACGMANYLSRTLKADSKKLFFQTE